MKNIADFEKRFKDKANILMVLDYNGTITSIEPKLNSPLSNTKFKRVLENFVRKDYIKIIIITDRQIKEFKNEFGINSEKIDIYGFFDNRFKNESGKEIIKKENIIAEIIAENPENEVIYVGDDKQLIAKIKQLKGYAIGILPLCTKGEKLVDFAISQNKFEESLITANNLYL